MDSVHVQRHRAAETPSWIPAVVAFGPTRTRRRASGTCASSMRSLWMKPPAVARAAPRPPHARAERLDDPADHRGVVASARACGGSSRRVGLARPRHGTP
jgi:hypothetical protein